MLSCYSVLHIHILHLYHHCHHHHHHHCHHCHHHHHSRYPFSLFFFVSNTNQEVKTKEERKKTTTDCVSDFSPPTYSISSPSHLLILSTLDFLSPHVYACVFFTTWNAFPPFRPYRIDPTDRTQPNRFLLFSNYAIMFTTRHTRTPNPAFPIPRFPQTGGRLPSSSLTTHQKSDSRKIPKPQSPPGLACSTFSSMMIFPSGSNDSYKPTSKVNFISVVASSFLLHVDHAFYVFFSVFRSSDFGNVHQPSRLTPVYPAHPRLGGHQHRHRHHFINYACIFLHNS